MHEAVSRVILTGSRGLAGHPRPDSDIDLTLLVDTVALSSARDRAGLLYDVLQVTSSAWMGPCELDLAAAFDISGCGLRCFGTRSAADIDCRLMRPDCFGLYKTTKGFHGFVAPIGLLIEKACPMIAVWESPPAN